MSFVRLVDHMGSDQAIVQAARVSYGGGTKAVSDDRTLIRYLLRNWHTTPFEMVEFKFHVKCPIFVARQWLRHRTASVNEISARYSVIQDDFYVPTPYSKQSQQNKQGSSYEYIDEEHLSLDAIAACGSAFNLYNRLLDAGVSREQARIHLPQGTFTEFYWKIDLHNLFGFLHKRMDSHAQKEIRDLAKQMYTLIKPHAPMACEAFEDYRLGAITLSRLEIQAIRDSGRLENRREQGELEEKLKLMGLVK